MRIGRSKTTYYYCCFMSSASLWLQVVLVLFTIPEILKGCDGCWEHERIALLPLKSSLHDPDYFWGGGKGTKHHSDVDCCHWDGVRCHPTTGRVTKLMLWNENSTTRPYLNASLLFLPFQGLRALSLQSYHILGCMENLGFLKRLEIFDSTIACNNFLDTLGTVMTNLTHLVILDASLSSTIPQAFCNLKHLREIVLQSDDLRGELPNCLSNLTSLQIFNVGGNQFDGDIAESPLTTLLSLEEIDIIFNQFRIPISLFPFFNHSRLRSFRAGHNRELYGDDDQYDLVRQDTPLFQLVLLHLSSSDGNNVGGYVGPAFPKFLYHQTRLEYVSISDVRIKGAVGFPWWLLANNTNLGDLQLPSCSLSGQFQLPTIVYENLTRLVISSNDFLPGHIPHDICTFFPNIDSLSVSENNFFGKIPPQWSNCSSLQTLEASDNQLSGEIPKWIWNDSTLLVLDLSSNDFSGGLPPGFISPSMNEVYLSRNRLGGTLYDQNGITGDIDYSGYQLRILDLSHNHFTGKIPKWIVKLRPRLRYILLNDNHLYGEVPAGFCLENTNLIDLSHNRLSGHIVGEIFQCTLYGEQSGYSPYGGMEFVTKTHIYTYKGQVVNLFFGLDLSNNDFTGEIPIQIGHLDNTQVLNLSYNKFTGPIPSSIANLSQIESLDLSHNNLSGAIPYQLTDLHSLSSFNVAYNNLSGMCPLKTAQFSTFDESSYEGNPFLNCTLPLVTPNPSVRSTTSDDDDDDDGEEGFIDMESFYVSGSVSYVMVLLIIASVLYINSYWRRVWFYYVGVTITTCYYFVVDHLPVPARYKVWELRV
ncbi:unnamed protein product [Linum tenue]|uniref:Leucine-rich repeat-containing N-terminal plant-type domain-containing protein n=1 Tax=Linum tenue TaxID=586396 RepID=A0AAV0QAJ5_9ROSI|nr:unnamed protein product [Linum tenue]